MFCSTCFGTCSWFQLISRRTIEVYASSFVIYQVIYYLTFFFFFSNEDFHSIECLSFLRHQIKKINYDAFNGNIKRKVMK